LKNETYVGQTEDIGSRLVLHNRGRVRSTSHGIPWRVIHTEECSSRAGAMAREKWFKSKSGRMEIGKILGEMKEKL
jgi:putative endonuclease